ncbi:DinB family protein [Fulvivirga sp. M361]|uniref:DUF1569 domain-containing protein n=1 Tax=Fulvivirga sp. M361 TaxID=2594266 RepID=UPI00117993F5|nr:DUF1569 domain-containing protein [Fulvivirga sp. M361]TRX59206.1 DinB family protein [Fulvivirga sp. M361]
MKTIFDETSRVELIERISKLSSEHKAQWGKMTVGQMIAHMNIWNEWVLGKNDLPHQQSFLGKLIGKWMLKKDTKDATPMAKGMPAGKEFTINEVNDNIDKLKEQWVHLIQEYEDYSEWYFMHDFYGKMTREQIGIFAYKHTDHHLRQFNV